MEENANQPIGEPQPIDAREGRKILKRMAQVLALTSGVAFFAALLLPTRTSGASRSARLQWQQRQKEIREVMNQNQPVPEKAERLAGNQQDGPTGR
jgi:hypothetical protein